MAPKTSITDDTLDDSWAVRNGNNNLLDTKNQLPKGESTSTSMMPRAMSMLEMNEIQDMMQFGEAMEAISHEQGVVDVDAPTTKNAAAANHNNDNADDGLFIDSSDHDLGLELEDSDPDDQFLQLSTSPDSVTDAAAQWTAKKPSNSSGGGMRRVMSMASMTSSRVQNFGGLSSMMAISEEGPSDNNCIPKKSDPNKSLNRMPLRSSLKGSANNLRSRRNRSSNSLQSACSSMDDTNHSINSLASDSGQEENDDEQEELSRTSASSNNLKRNVSFSSLEIRSYNVTLGTAPTACGPPVTLDWEYDPSATEQHSLEQYEAYRSSEAPRRSKREMLMPPMHRHYLLMREAGCTKSEIKEATEEAKRVGRQRENTVRGLRFGFMQPMEEVLEKTKRKIFRKRR